MCSAPEASSRSFASKAARELVELGWQSYDYFWRSRVRGTLGTSWWRNPKISGPLLQKLWQNRLSWTDRFITICEDHGYREILLLLGGEIWRDLDGSRLDWSLRDETRMAKWLALFTIMVRWQLSIRDCVGVLVGEFHVEDVVKETKLAKVGVVMMELQST